MISNTVKIGYINIAGAGMAYIREYDPKTLTARTMVNGDFINVAWNGSSWAPVQAQVEVQESSPAPVVEKSTLVVEKSTLKSALSRKALVTKLQSMNPDQVLFAGWKRNYSNNGSREYATLIVLESLLDLPAVGQSHHSTKRGKMVSNPKWMTQLYTDITWSTGDITPKMILQVLA